MSAASKILRLKQTRGALKGIMKQIGLRNGIVTLCKALIKSRLKRSDIPKAFLVSFWDTLGDREAIISEDRRITFGQYKDRVLRLANGLNGLGMEPGERFGEMLYNGIEWFEAMGAGTLTGRSMPMLNWHLKPGELVNCINKAETKALIFDSDFLDTIDSIRDQLKTVDHFIVVGGEAPEGYISYERLIADSPTKLPDGEIGMSATPYSGGTTGAPKFINMDEMKNAFGDSDEKRRGASKDEAKALGLKTLSIFHWFKIGAIKDPISKNIRSLIPGPLYHAGTLVGVLPFFLGGTVIPMRRFKPETYLRTIQEERANWTFVAPTMLERILALPEDEKGKYNLQSMCSLICAAAPCPPQVKKDINTLFRNQGNERDVFFEYYGASETGVITVLVPEDYQANPKYYDSVGKSRAGDCMIYDEEKGEPAPIEKEGKVMSRSPMTLALEYKGDQEKTAKAFININGQAWYDDGLIGYLDENDFLYLTSRAKEMIISGGVNIFPNEIENVIKQHPNVFDVAVIRAPDDDLGEVPAAIVQLKKGVKSSSEEIIEHCKAQGLYGFKMPRIIDFEDELPRQLSGKLIKRELEDRYWQGVEKHG